MVAVLVPCLWICAMFYSFFCQALVCEEYFVPALNVVIDRFKIPDDVAGATLMAMGTSAPELFCNLIALFATHTVDAGVGTIVGSDLFNMFMICGGSAIVGGTLELDWTVLAREIIFYCLSIALLYWTLADQIVLPFEAWVLVGAYVFYAVVCCVQKPIMEKCAPKAAERLEHAAAPVIDHTAEDSSPEKAEIGVSKADAIADLKKPLRGNVVDVGRRTTGTGRLEKIAQHAQLGMYSGYVTERAKLHLAGGHVWYRCYAVLTEDDDGKPTFTRCESHALAQTVLEPGIARKATSWHHEKGDTLIDQFLHMGEMRDVKAEEIGSVELEGDKVFNVYLHAAMNPIVFQCDTKQDRDEWVKKLTEVVDKVAKELGPEAIRRMSHVSMGEHMEHVKHDLWHIPPTATGKLLWLIELPANIAFMYTIPDVKVPEFERFYALSILMFLIWLPILSYIMVTALNSVSEAWGLSPALMALTVGAAGTSFPDFFASLIVAKQGQGNMAVSNAFGSNIFNIFFASGLPWALYMTTWADDDSMAKASSSGVRGIFVPSDDVVQGVITLAISVILFIAVMTAKKFVLTPAIGWFFAACWALYIVYAVYSSVTGGSG